MQLQTQVDSRYPQIVIPLASLSAPLATFFAVPVFFAVLGLLVLDLVTGLTKAHMAKKVCSQNFGLLFERMALYIVIFIVLHGLTAFTPAPFNMGSQLIENFVMTGLLLKEALSNLENLKAIAALRGWDVPVLDTVINKLGLDLDHILADVKDVKTLPETAEEAAKALSEAQTPSETATPKTPTAPNAP